MWIYEAVLEMILGEGTVVMVMGRIDFGLMRAGTT